MMPSGGWLAFSTIRYMAYQRLTLPDLTLPTAFQCLPDAAGSSWILTPTDMDATAGLDWTYHRLHPVVPRS